MSGPHRWEPRRLGLRPPLHPLRAEAARAVRAELRRCSAPMELQVRAVAPVPDGRGRLSRLDVDAMDLAWTWEGSELLDEHGFRGVVVGVDEDAGRLFVDADQHPSPGSFVARPFEFLRAVADLLDSEAFDALGPDLSCALAAAAGERRGVRIDSPPGVPGLEETWRWSWGALWGPPGTGKTQTVAAQVAQALDDPEERILLVSTTNRATDELALRVGAAQVGRTGLLEGLLRLGVGANMRSFADAGMAELLVGGESELRWMLAELESRRRKASPEEAARLTQQARMVRRQLAEAPLLWTDPTVRVVMSTAFSAVQRLAGDERLRELARNGEAAFTTVIIDESGLVSRARAAALAMLASRRVLLAGDPRQLAPIARLARVLPPDEARWLASSALSHLSDRDAARPDVSLLTLQHRMAPAIRQAVSRFQYGGVLRDGAGVTERAPWDGGELLRGQPRALWYVLDEDAGDDLSKLRGRRGPKGRSWMRRRSLEVFATLLQRLPPGTRGLFVTPFRAQVEAARTLLADHPGWEASTVHAQQGSQAEVVVFDTVHAGSTTWPLDEWKRLINVGLSRAREQLILLATRDEMAEPYLVGLVADLAPRALAAGRWVAVEARVTHGGSAETRQAHPERLGAQIESRKALRPVLSGEQERLARYRLDGKPRLVRGVAGSGKTLVLARWMARTLARGEGPAWVVFANVALRGLLMEQVLEAWKEVAPLLPLPSERWELLHVQDVLFALRTEVGLPPGEGWDLDAQAREVLETAAPLPPRCAALFVDEAQDFGPHTLSLLSRLVFEKDGGRPVMVFWDNAQNVYGRGTPRWAGLGLDMVGRSTVMQESFRGTRPTMELALNTLARLTPLERDPDHRELLGRGLLRKIEAADGVRWRVEYCQVDGIAPEVEWYPSREAELAQTTARIAQWIGEQGVRPRDIKVLCNGGEVRRAVVEALRLGLLPLGVRVEEQTRRSFTEADDTLVVTTAHSFKGYEAELVVVPAADRFVGAGGRPLASALYVAMTRARSLLRVTGLRQPSGEGAKEVVRAVRWAALSWHPAGGGP